MALLTVDSLSVGYDGKIVVQDISFCVNSGDYLCVIGENGAGKSTLIRSILSLHRPASGNIMLGDGLRWTDIGYLPQAKDVQKDFPASVYEIVVSGCLNKCGLRPFFNRTERNLALESMKNLGILQLKNRCYRELSGGQQQRVLLARALCASKRLIILDEPVASLDPDATADMYDIIDRLNKDGVAIVMVSHDIATAKKCASHILKIENGRAFIRQNGGKNDNI